MKFVLEDFNAEAYDFIDAKVVRNRIIKTILGELKQAILSKEKVKGNYLLYTIPRGYEEEIKEILKSNHFSVTLDVKGMHKISW